MVLLENGDMVYLPPRFYDVINTQKQVDELNSSKYLMVYKGKDAKLKNWIDVDFDEIPSQIIDDNVDDKRMKIDEDPHYKEYMSNEGQNIDAYLQSAQFGYDTVDRQ